MTQGYALPKHYDLMYAREALAYGLKCLLNKDDPNLQRHAETIIQIIENKENDDEHHASREYKQWDMSDNNFYGSLTMKAKDGSMTNEVFIRTMVQMAPYSFKVPFENIMTVQQLRKGDPPNTEESLLEGACRLFLGIKFSNKSELHLSSIEIVEESSFCRAHDDLGAPVAGRPSIVCLNPLMVLNALRRCDFFFDREQECFDMTKIYINTALHCLRVLGIDAPDCKTSTLRGTQISGETVRSLVDQTIVFNWYNLPKKKYKVDRNNDAIKIIP